MTDNVQNQRDRITDARDAAAYRSMMDDIDTSRHAPNTRAREHMAAGVTRKMTEALGGNGMADLPSEAKDAVVGVRDVVMARETAVGQAATKLYGILSNDREWPANRAKDADAALAETRSTLSTQAQVFDAAYFGAQEALLEAARPKVQVGEEQTARADARMLLDGANTANEARVRVQNYLDGNDDSTAAILSNSRWLSTYFTGRGWSDSLSHVEPLVRAKIAESARNSQDKSRVAAGNFLSTLHNFQAANDGVSAMAGYLDPRSKK